MKTYSVRIPIYISKEILSGGKTVTVKERIWDTLATGKTFAEAKAIRREAPKSEIFPERQPLTTPA